MCLICNSLYEVLSVSPIPGLGELPSGFHVFFPWEGELPFVGQTLNKQQLTEQQVQADSSTNSLT